jgi:hypothetical protein
MAWTPPRVCGNRYVAPFPIIAVTLVLMLGCFGFGYNLYNETPLIDALSNLFLIAVLCYMLLSAYYIAKVDYHVRYGKYVQESCDIPLEKDTCRKHAYDMFMTCEYRDSYNATIAFCVLSMLLWCSILVVSIKNYDGFDGIWDYFGLFEPTSKEGPPQIIKLITDFIYIITYKLYWALIAVFQEKFFYFLMGIVIVVLQVYIGATDSQIQQLISVGRGDEMYGDVIRAIGGELKL